MTQLTEVREYMSEFILPPVKGIEGTIEHVREFSLRNGVEKIVALDPLTGVKVFEHVGTDRYVEVPGVFERRSAGLFLVHNHPVVTELSLPDIWTSNNLRCAGIMAVCNDYTISWTHGSRRVSNEYQMLIDNIRFQQLDREVAAKFNVGQYAERSPKWYREVIREAAWKNQRCLELGLLVDYFVRRGPENAEIVKGVV